MIKIGQVYNLGYTSLDRSPNILSQNKLNKMIVVNFKDNLPTFGEPGLENKTINTKSPSSIFYEQKKPDKSRLLHLEINCACSDTGCKNNVTFYFSGLNYYFNSRNIGNDRMVCIDPGDRNKDKNRSDSVLWEPSEENIAKFVAFAETAREAVAFKNELMKGLFALLQVHTKEAGEIQIAVRKENEEIRFILFRIPVVLQNVPLLRESESYRNCLGLIATLPIDTDTSKIKNEYANMEDPFFAPVVSWVELIGKENQQDLSIKHIWVMPE